MRKLAVISFLTLLVLGSCKKEEEITSDFYFSATINGNAVLLQDEVDGYGSGVAYSGSGYTVEQGLLLTAPLSSVVRGDVGIVKTFSYVATCDEIIDMFSVKKYSYGNPNQEIDGATVCYIDENGTIWSSYYGTGNQTGSAFEIIEHTVNNDGFSLYITKATFSCTLYDIDGNTKTLSNGEIRSRSVLCD